MKKLILVAALGLMGMQGPNTSILGPSTTSQARVESQWFSYSKTSHPQGRIDVQQFDPSLGTLRSIKVAGSSIWGGWIQLENQVPGPSITATTHFHAIHQVFDFIGGIYTHLDEQHVTSTSPPFQAVFGVPRITFYEIPLSGAVEIPSTAFNSWMGTGLKTIALRHTGSANTTPSPSIGFRVINAVTRSRAQVTITYTYEPI